MSQIMISSSAIANCHHTLCHWCFLGGISKSLINNVFQIPDMLVTSWDILWKEVVYLIRTYFKFT